MKYKFVYLRFHDKENLENVKAFLGDSFISTIDYFYYNKFNVFALQFKKGDGSVCNAFLNDFIVKEDNNFIVYNHEDFYEKFMILGGNCKIEE